MMSKIIIKVLALSTCGLSLAVPSAVAVNETNNSYVYVIYDAGAGTFSDGSSRTTITTRKGTRWSRRMSSERPSTPTRASFNFNEWTINDDSIQDTYVFNNDITIKATYTVTPSTKSWDNDTWAQLAAEADKGLDSLKSNYGFTTSLIGKTKSVKYNGKDYTARVIGENHDTLSSDHSTKAALTFEVVELIDNISYSGYTANSNIYETSNLRTTLNSTVLNLFEDNLKDYVKSVDKITHKGGGGSKYGNLGTYSDKIFTPSIKEMNIKADVPHAIQEEGFAYEYYETLSSFDDYKRCVLGSSTPIAYWTRSPDVETAVYSWHINDSGKIGDYDPTLEEQSPLDVRTSAATSVCFAL